MKEIKVTVYYLEELSKKAQNRAYNDWLKNCEYDYSENQHTLDTFCDIFGIKVVDYNGMYNYVKFYFEHDEEIDELSGVRLFKYLHNNHFDDLFPKKTFTKKGRVIESSYDICCPLTGYWIDDLMLEPIYKFLKKPNKNTTFYDLIEDCLLSWLRACVEDEEYMFSFDYFKDECSGNGSVFFENGEVYDYHYDFGIQIG